MLTKWGVKCLAYPCPPIQSVIPIGMGATVVQTGNQIRCYGYGDTGLRINFKLTELVGGATYCIDFNFLSLIGDTLEVDWCDDEANQKLYSAPASVSLRVSRPSYDATYRFLDIGDYDGDEGEGFDFTITVPTIRRVN
jgi:hypothetical protein